jgi:acetolactate synthase-1/2/3 large subunit
MTSKRQLLIDKLLQLRLPTVLTWGAKDLLPSDSEFLLGTFGTHGERRANIALNQADLIISIGSRLDLKATGTPVSTFAPNAHKIMIDIDEFEKSKFDKSGLQISTYIKVDIESDEFDSFLRDLEFDETKVLDWKRSSIKFKEEFPAENRCFPGEGVNPYKFIKVLADSVLEPLNLIVDTGCAIAWTMQGWETKSNQRIFHDYNNTAMGWSIPATIASALSIPDKTHICLVGDGSLMMALSDLSTLSSLPALTKIVVINNFGYSMIKQTQDQWFDGEYFASSSETDLSFPNFSKLAGALGFAYFSVNSDSEVKEIIRQVLIDDRPLMLEVFVQESARVVPIVKFGNPNHIMEPSLAEYNK